MILANCPKNTRTPGSSPGQALSRQGRGKGPHYDLAVMFKWNRY